MNLINTIITLICTLLTTIATVALSVFAFQARDSFLKQELYNFGWNFLQDYQNYIEWLLENKVKLDKELTSENTSLASINYNKFNKVERAFLRLEIMTEEKIFSRTREQINKIHKLNLQYYSKDNSNEAQQIRNTICSDLLQINVAIPDFLDFINSNIKTKKIKLSNKQRGKIK